MLSDRIRKRNQPRHAPPCVAAFVYMAVMICRFNCFIVIDDQLQPIFLPLQADLSLLMSGSRTMIW